MPTSGFLRNHCRKTQLCQAFETGACGKGKKCRFAHGASELRTRPDLRCTQLCPSLGACRDAACVFAHAESELRVLGQTPAAAAAPKAEALPEPPMPSAALLATTPPWTVLARVAPPPALEYCGKPSAASAASTDGESTPTSPTSPWSSEAADWECFEGFEVMVKNTFLELWEEQELPMRKSISAQARLEGNGGEGEATAVERSRRRRHSDPEAAALAMPR